VLVGDAAAGAEQDNLQEEHHEELYPDAAVNVAPVEIYEELQPKLQEY
jgi:hypothetical protein